MVDPVVDDKVRCPLNCHNQENRDVVHHLVLEMHDKRDILSLFGYSFVHERIGSIRNSNTQKEKHRIYILVNGILSYRLFDPLFFRFFHREWECFVTESHNLVTSSLPTVVLTVRSIAFSYSFQLCMGYSQKAMASFLMMYCAYNKKGARIEYNLL